MSFIPSQQITAPVQVFRTTLPYAMAATLVFSLSLLCILLSRQPGAIASIWLPNAVIAAFIVRRPKRETPYLCVVAGFSGFAANWLYGDSWGLSLAFCFANLMESMLVVAVLRKLRPDGFRFEEAKEAVQLIISALVPPLIGAFLGATALYHVNGLPFLKTASAWYAGSSIGMLVVLPPALIITREEVRKHIEPKHLKPFFILLGFTLGITFLAAHLSAPYIFMVLPLLVAAVRLPLLQSLLINLFNLLLLFSLIAAKIFIPPAVFAANEPIFAYLPLAFIALPAFVLAVIINDKMQKQGALIASEERFRGAMENSVIGMALVGLDGRWIKVNRAVCEIVGYSEQELMRMTFQDITHPDDLNADLEYVADMLAGRRQSYQMEKRYIRKNGQVVWILLAVSFALDSDGKPSYFVSQIQDISARKEAEEKHAKLTERIVLAMQAGGDGVWEWNIEEDRLMWDDRMYEMYGLVKGDSMLRYQSWSNRLHPDDLFQTEEQFQLALTGAKAFDTQFRIIRTDGETRYIHAVARLIRDNNGYPLRMVGINADVTAQVSAETALTHANQQLKRSYDDIAQANEDVRNFAFIVSHDLRAPLVNIQGFARELSQDIDEVKTLFATNSSSLQITVQQALNQLLNNDIKESLTFVRSAAARMDKQITSVLRLSKLGRQTMQIESIDLTELVSVIIRSHAHELEAANGKVTVAPLQNLLGDYNVVEQILSNVINNAVKYREANRPLHIEIWADSSTEGTTLHIKDNGRGMKEDDIPRVFELFRRVGVQDTVGEGMGLNYVQTLVRRLNGYLRCESSLGQGSTFHVFLPDLSRQAKLG